jgi:hypothetical protein
MAGFKADLRSPNTATCRFEEHPGQCCNPI